MTGLGLLPPNGARTPEVSGPILFARYAYGPNRLGLCGPDAPDELLGQAAVGGDDRALRELAKGFEGAWPYLALIAAQNRVADPLDRRVVEAYWLGGDLLDGVSARGLGGSLDDRFRRRLRPREWRWLAETPLAGARPSHAFHVLDVYPRLGLLRGGGTDRVLETIDACRIRWGEVVDREGDSLIVEAVPLTMIDGHLVLGEPRRERVRGWRDGTGFLDAVEPADIVSIHWDWACERLSPERLATLVIRTRDELAIASLSI